MRTETLAIVFTDIKGYTAATSTQSHQENAHMLKRIERLIAPVVRAFSGEVIKSIGDAYMIVFRSPTEAVKCAMAVQDRLHQHNTSSAADQAVHIRIAMNLGEVRFEKGDVFGEPVNVAARVEKITPADEIFFSEAVYLTMNRSEIMCEKVGDYEFKGVPDPVTVFRAKKFAHVVNEDENTTPGEATQVAQGLPFGGVQLEHWKRMRWLRPAYIAMWALSLSGLALAAYFRYRPTTDYAPVVAAVKAAVDAGHGTDALALAGQIPKSATQESALVRRYRQQAVSQLLDSGNVEVARNEIEALLADDNRDGDSLLLKALLLGKDSANIRDAIANLQAALKNNPALAGRPEVAVLVVQGYADAGARRISDSIVETYLKQNAAPSLQRALADGFGDRVTRNAIATRLEKLGSGQDIDWVALAIEDLKSNSCKTRKNAIVKLSAEGDERGVGPLLKLAESKGCGASQAKEAAQAILGK